jgi:hypothetical protein
MAYVVSLFDIMTTKKISKKSIIIFIISSVGMSLFKHATIISIIADLIISIIMTKKYKNIWKIPLTSLIICLISYSFMYGVVAPHILHAIKTPYNVKYTIPMYMIESFINDGYGFTKDQMEELEKIQSIEEYKKEYQKYTTTPSDGSPGHLKINEIKPGKEIIKINYQLFIEHPYIYLRNLSNMDSILFEISRPIDGYNFAPIKNHAIEYDDLYIDRYKNFFCTIKVKVEEILGSLPITEDILFRGGFYQLMYIIYIFILITYKEKEKIIYFLPIIIIQLLLYISVPEQDSRYILHDIMVFPIITIIVFSNNNRKRLKS